MDPKDVGVHVIQIFVTEINSASVLNSKSFLNKFKLSIIGLKKPIQNNIKNDTTKIVK